VVKLTIITSLISIAYLIGIIKRYYIGMKDKFKNSIFICQITENYLKAIKCLSHNKSKAGFVGLETESIPADIDDKKLSEILNQVFKKLDYRLNPIIVSLPRALATCRYLKVPASGPEEIENIAQLQASRYLPYPAQDLITAFQRVSTDNEGFSHINLVIVHRATIERYLRVFKDLKPAKISMVLSSYGLNSLYSYVRPDDAGPVVVVELDSQQVEIAIISSKKLLFSRSFKLARTAANWPDLLIEQINRTRDVFLKEIPQEAPQKIVLVGSQRALSGLPDNLSRQMSLAIEVLPFTEQVNLTEEVKNNILNQEHSFAGLIGLGLREPEGSLNLLPEEMKKAIKNIAQRKRILHTSLSISVIILVLGLGIAKDLDNKSRYLARLKTELNKIQDEAKPLEDIEKRFALLAGQVSKKQTGLDMLYELHQVIPDEISLASLSIEEAKVVILHGQAPELNSVSVFVERLEKSAAFKGFDVKVRYATAKKTQSRDVIDFEIVCLRK
jgi:Tfp pilus assembly PilM family ATPase/Tfp pilus assembly protein PilN